LSPACTERSRLRGFAGRRRNDPAEVLMHQPPHQKAFVCPAEKPYLAFKARWPRFHFSRSLGLLAERTGQCPCPAPPAQTPSQSHFRRRSGALRVFPFVIINRGLNLKYVERPKLGHFAIFPRGRQYPCADHSDLSGQVVSRKNASLRLKGRLFVKLFLAPGWLRDESERPDGTICSFGSPKSSVVGCERSNMGRTPSPHDSPGSPAAVQFRALIHVSGHSFSGQILRFHAKTL
jgi:hypothetical protein